MTTTVTTTMTSTKYTQFMIDKIIELCIEDGTDLHLSLTQNGYARNMFCDSRISTWYVLNDSNENCIPFSYRINSRLFWLPSQSYIHISNVHSWPFFLNIIFHNDSNCTVSMRWRNFNWFGKCWLKNTVYHQILLEIKIKLVK